MQQHRDQSGQLHHPLCMRAVLWTIVIIKQNWVVVNDFRVCCDDKRLFQWLIWWMLPQECFLNCLGGGIGIVMFNHAVYLDWAASVVLSNQTKCMQLSPYSPSSVAALRAMLQERILQHRLRKSARVLGQRLFFS